jgi:hypothetical protein
VDIVHRLATSTLQTSIPLTGMTTAEILAGIENSLRLIETERGRLLEARAQLIRSFSTEPPKHPASPRHSVARTSRVRRGQTLKRIIGALDKTEPRTAGDIAKATSVERTLVAATLIRLVKRGDAVKASRGYLRAED